MNRLHTLGFLPLLLGLPAVASAVASAQSDAPPERVTDEVAAATAEGLLQQDPAVDPRQLTVRVRDHILELTGTVDSLRAARHAVERCLSVRGVDAVIDRLVVQRHGDDRQALADRVAEALAEHAETRDIEVELEALADGSIRIQTTATGDRAAQLADVAESVPGVQRVVLVVGEASEEPPTDAEIQAAVERRLARDAWLSAAQLSVVVTDGTVHLAGQITGQDLLERAADLALVPGAVRVDPTAVAVLEQPAEPGVRRQPIVVADDDLQQVLRRVFEMDQRVHADEVRIRVADGVVTLEGTTRDAAALDAMVQDARNTLGVRRVDCRVTVSA